MPKYRKKPVVIEAVQNKGKHESDRKKIMEFMGLGSKEFRQCADASILIETLEGTMICDYLDWIVKGVSGGYYPCKANIFEKTYERVDE